MNEQLSYSVTSPKTASIQKTAGVNAVPQSNDYSATTNNVGFLYRVTEDVMRKEVS